MVVEKTSTSGPKQPPLNSLLRKLPDGGTGVQIAILKTCKSSTATVDGHMQRYIDTSLTVTSETSRIDVICAARSSKAELMTTIDASLLSKGEELINWSSNEVYTIKLEKIDVQVASARSAKPYSKCAIMLDSYVMPSLDVKFVPFFAVLAKVDRPSVASRHGSSVAPERSQVNQEAALQATYYYSTNARQSMHVSLRRRQSMRKRSNR